MWISIVDFKSENAIRYRHPSALLTKKILFYFNIHTQKRTRSEDESDSLSTEDVVRDATRRALLELAQRQSLEVGLNFQLHSLGLCFATLFWLVDEPICSHTPFSVYHFQFEPALFSFPLIR